MSSYKQEKKRVAVYVYMNFNNALSPIICMYACCAAFKHRAASFFPSKVQIEWNLYTIFFFYIITSKTKRPPLGPVQGI